jgi:hypothetical protein
MNSTINYKRLSNKSYRDYAEVYVDRGIYQAIRFLRLSLTRTHLYASGKWVGYRTIHNHHDKEFT